MVNIQRVLNIELEQGQSAFLWGPRKTGKSTYLKQAFPESIVYNFLKTDVALDLIRSPSLLREQLLTNSEQAAISPVIMDEVCVVRAPGS